MSDCELTAKLAGYWTLRVSVSYHDRVIPSSMVDFILQYPSYDHIRASTFVRGQFQYQWNQTLNVTKNDHSKRREVGCWVYFNTKNFTYSFENVLGPIVGISEQATITMSKPSMTSETNILVAFFHTHTPSTYRSGYRIVGESEADRDIVELYKVVGILYDYVGETSDNGLTMMINSGHDINAPYKLSQYGYFRKPLTE